MAYAMDLGSIVLTDVGVRLPPRALFPRPALRAPRQTDVCNDGHMVERDRDESGRPRSTRPRDPPGRPLPKGSQGVPRIADDLELPPAETLAYAQDLTDRG